jgi:AbrB family looped-hinge helix DNA binding protein
VTEDSLSDSDYFLVLSKNFNTKLATKSCEEVKVLEKHIKVSTQGRLTIPKQIRDSLKISDGQPVVVKSNSEKREIIIQLQPVISDYR